MIVPKVLAAEKLISIAQRFLNLLQGPRPFFFNFSCQNVKEPNAAAVISASSAISAGLGAPYA